MRHYQQLSSRNPSPASTRAKPNRVRSMLLNSPSQINSERARRPQATVAIRAPKPGGKRVIEIPNRSMIRFSSSVLKSRQAYALESLTASKAGIHRASAGQYFLEPAVDVELERLGRAQAGAKLVR